MNDPTVVGMPLLIGLKGDRVQLALCIGQLHAIAHLKYMGAWILIGAHIGILTELQNVQSEQLCSINAIQ